LRIEVVLIFKMDEQTQSVRGRSNENIV